MHTWATSTPADRLPRRCSHQVLVPEIAHGQHLLRPSAALAWDMQFRGQVNMPYNALQGLPGCFPSHYLRRKAGEYALGGPPEGPVLPSEFRGWEVPGVP